MSLEAAETPADIIEQPVPWIVQHQRAQCSGASPLTTFQGLICDEIVLPQSAAEHSDPAQLVLAADAWVEALTNQAQLGILRNGGNPDAATQCGGGRSSDCKLLL